MTMPLRFRRPTLLLWSAPLLMAALSGCSLFEVPEHLELPPQPTMPPLKPKYVSTDGSTLGNPLNEAGSQTMPDAYRATRVEFEPVDPVGGLRSGTGGGNVVIYLQKVRYVSTGTPGADGGASGSGVPGGSAPSGSVAPVGNAAASGNTATGNVAPNPAPDATRPGRTRRASLTPTPSSVVGAGLAAIPLATPAPGVALGDIAPVKLAGVTVPLNEPYRTAAYNTIINWLFNSNPKITDIKKNDLDVSQDKVYPFDLKGRARVQIMFKGHQESNKTESFNLNRLMVRSGYAVADLYSPTTFDVNVWFNDEQIAQGKVSGSRPVGLWRYPGFALEHRLAPTPTPKPTSTPLPGAAKPKSGTAGTASSRTPATGTASGRAASGNTATANTMTSNTASNSASMRR